MNVDIVFITLPILAVYPQTNVACLQANIMKHGFTSKILDWNLKFYKKSKFSFSEYAEGSSDWLHYFNTVDNNFSFMNKEGVDIIDNNINDWFKEIEFYNPKFIGISLNSHLYHDTMYRLIKKIRLHFHDKKIIIGGSNPLNNIYLEKKCVDYYVKGEGEDAILQILKNKNWKNSNITFRIEDLDNYPDPDYTNINIKNYPGNTLGIYSSRGCVRRCNFCFGSIKQIRYRDPEHIANEILDLYKKYGISRFIFNDSITNSNRRQLIKICKRIIYYKKMKKLPNRISFVSHFCVFPEKNNDNILYKLLYRAGFRTLIVGIESGSEKIRKDMNKKINTKDILSMFKYCSNNKIKVFPTFIIGYYTETEEEFNETLNLIEQMSKVIKKEYLYLYIGETFFIDSNNLSYWYSKGIKDDGIESWYYKENSYPVRFDRWLRIHEFCLEIDVNTTGHSAEVLYNKLLLYKNNYDIQPLINRFNKIRKRR
jgi:radical SAM superfamily enzyme YgiQ (UPF0313 family)